MMLLPDVEVAANMVYNGCVVNTAYKGEMHMEPITGFPYHSLKDIQDAAARMGLDLPLSEDLGVLGQPVAGDGFVLPNALAVHPMEGCDGTSDGKPSELTLRRYERFARGGAGLLWVEAVAVHPTYRANPRQLMITEENVPTFRAMVDMMRRAAEESCGHRPLIIAQLTHSGRWSRPESAPAPIIGWHDALLDAHQKLPDDYVPITDAELKDAVANIARGAALCREAGFDGVDLKACHLYLYSEMLGVVDRPGPYGGVFENRIRLMLETADAARAATGSDYILASRLNFHDNTAGRWGNDANGQPDFTEPLKLMGELVRRGEKLFNITMGTPYYNPHINRPYATGGYLPPEPPLAGVARLQSGVKAAQEAFPDTVCVGTGYSYLRNYSPYLAAGAVKEGWAKVAGFGRQSFADPAFANKILKEGGLDTHSACLACGKCTMLMRAGSVTGCPVRDQDVYLPLYRQYVMKK